MKLIFCSSYLNLPVSITLAKKSNEKFKILTEDLSVSIFLKKIFKNDEVIELPSMAVSTSNLPRILKIISVMRSKCALKNLVAPYKDCNVYYFDVAYATAAAYSVKHLANKNKIFYNPIVELNAPVINCMMIRNIIERLYLKFMFGLDVRPLQNGNSITFVYTEKFFKKLKCTRSKFAIDHTLLKNIVKTVYKDKNKKILLLSGSVVDLNLVDPEVYEKNINIVINLLGKDNLAIKLHPRSNKKYGDEHSVYEIDNLIPANIIMYGFDTIVGYNSATLFEAANAGIKAISLMDFIPPLNTDTALHFKNYIKSNTEIGSQVLFPRTASDLSDVIAY